MAMKLSFSEARGRGRRYADEAYVAAGARIVPDAEALFSQAELIVKVKEPLPAEIASPGGPGTSSSRTCTWRRTAG